MSDASAHRPDLPSVATDSRGLMAGGSVGGASGARVAGQVGVGVGVLVVHAGRVLLGRRRGSHGAGTWSAPGGRLEYGEQIVDCAARELREETGLVAASLTPGPYAVDIFPEVAQQYLTLFVVARGITGTPVNREPHKCDGWHWFAWGDWPQPLFPPVQSFLALGWRPDGL